MIGSRSRAAARGRSSDILANSVRQQPDVDALAAIDGDRIQILVWNYHDDLVDAEPAPVTLKVSVPPAFGAKAVVTHTRVDDTHGNAFTVWVSQGSPATPSAMQLTALREAMEPVVLEPEHVVDVAGGAVSLSFDLPRFGISLMTLAPSNASEHDASPASDAGCSCRFPAKARTPLLALLALCSPSRSLADGSPNARARALAGRRGMQHRTFTFAEFELDLETLELRRAGTLISIQRKPLEVLAHLLRHPARVVSKDELLRQVWPDVSVSEHALTSALRDLRRGLGDTNSPHRVIVTVRGQGYRFLGSAAEGERFAGSHPALDARLSRPEIRSSIARR